MKKRKFKLLALDLDGTLTNSQKKISSKNKEYISYAQSIGIKIILASGRPVLGIHPLAKELELYDKGGYILAYNGGHIIDCMTSTDLVKETIPIDLIHDICSINQYFNVHPLTYNDVGVICEDDQSEYVQREAFNNKIPVIKVHSLEMQVKKPVVKFMVVGDPNELKRSYAFLTKIYNGVLNIFFSEPYFLEVTPLGIDKAASLERMLSRLGVSRDELIACGDGLNDIPMLQYAGFSVAMGNSYDETKKYANAIVGTNEEDGVAEAIEKYIL